MSVRTSWNSWRASCTSYCCSDVNRSTILTSCHVSWPSMGQHISSHPSRFLSVKSTVLHNTTSKCRLPQHTTAVCVESTGLLSWYFFNTLAWKIFPYHPYRLHSHSDQLTGWLYRVPSTALWVYLFQLVVVARLCHPPAVSSFSRPCHTISFCFSFALCSSWCASSHVSWSLSCSSMTYW